MRVKCLLRPTSNGFFAPERPSEELLSDYLQSPAGDGGFQQASTWSGVRDYLLSEELAGAEDLEAAEKLWLDYRRFKSARMSREELLAENLLLQKELAQRHAGFQDKRLSQELPEGQCGLLAICYFTYKIIEALQPHPGYKSDDGFQPRKLLYRFVCENEAAPREVFRPCETGKCPLITVLIGLTARGAVIETAFEPCNGDVMLGLRENLGKRLQAYEERRSLISEGAARNGLQAKWNEDGTGWIETPSGQIVKACGSVWDLLSYLKTIATIRAEGPQVLH